MPFIFTIIIIIIIVIIYCGFNVCLVSPTIALGNGQDGSPSVAAGAVLSLMASVERFNLPLISITWMHNGSILVDKQNRVNITDPDLSSPAPVMAMLERSSLIPLDAGEYVATATNLVGSGMLNFNVAVTGETRMRNNM